MKSGNHVFGVYVFRVFSVFRFFFLNFIANVLANFSRMTGGARHRRMYVDADADPDADGKRAKQPGHIRM